jgi:RimJ/RimL family protein N-acetyltransferase
VSSDLDAVHALLSRMDVVRYMQFPLCSREESARFVCDSIRESAGAAWRSIVRAIVDGGDFVGLCGIVILRGTEEGELWYLVDPARQGRGLATEAARGLLALGFDALALHRLWACCLPENPASARVLEKAGLRREGLRLRNLKIHGEWKDSCLYAILEDEWRARAAAI